jgi:hypothetical protein
MLSVQVQLRAYICISVSLTKEQKELWKVGKCIWCYDKYEFGYQNNYLKRPSVNEVDVEEHVDNNNKEMEVYSSFTPHHSNLSLRSQYSNISRVRGPEIATKNESVERQRYDKKVKREPEFELDLNLSNSV